MSGDNDSPAAAIVASFAAASASLRDTAKWLVGGVAGAAAGIFAGSSLTNLGSLTFAEAPERLSMALGGALLGFLGLAMILLRAITVLTMESVDLPTLADSQDSLHVQVRDIVFRRYHGDILPAAGDLKAIVSAVIAANGKNDNASKALMRRYRSTEPVLMADAGFLHVHARFLRLVNALKLGSILAIIGFGLFAWAANPPEDKPAPAKAPLLTINRP